MRPEIVPVEGPAVARTPKGAGGEAGDGGGTLQAVERALRLLETLADSARPRTLQELGDAIGCSTSTVHRLMSTLSAHHFAERDPVSKRYRLGQSVFRLSEARARQIDLHLVAHPFLEALTDETLETASLWIRRGSTALCLATSQGRHEIRQFVEVGQVSPLTDLGAKSKILLAGMSRDEVDAVLSQVSWSMFNATPAQMREELAVIAETGVSRVFDGVHRDVSALAAALRDHRGEIVGVLAIAGPQSRWNDSAMDAAQDSLLGAADAISAQLGHRIAMPPGTQGVPSRSA